MVPLIPIFTLFKVLAIKLKTFPNESLVALQAAINTVKTVFIAFL